MKSSKIILASVMIVFMLSFASAVLVYGSFDDSPDYLSTTLDEFGFIIGVTIIEGTSVNFEVDFITPPETLSVTINGNSLSPVSEHSNYNLYTIPGTYSPGAYQIEIIGSDEFTDPSYLSLTVNPAEEPEPEPDTIAPVITLLGADEVELAVGATYIDPGATAEDNVDGNITSSIVTYNPVYTGVAGTYTVTYNVQDAAGNDATEVTRTVIVSASAPDTTDPIVNIIAPNNGQTYNAPVEYFNFIATDTNLDSCSYIINGASSVTVSCVSGTTKDVSITSVEGTNTLSVTAIDDSGNSVTETITFTVDTTVPDTTAPTINIMSPEAIEYNTSTINLRIITDEDVPIRTFSLDGTASIPMTNPSDHIFTYTLTNLEDGTHTVIFYAEDTSGNSASESVTFSIDTSEEPEDDDKKKSVGYSSLDDDTTDAQSQYLAQFEPKTIYLDDEEVEEKELSWFQQLIQSIKDFFKRLFGLK